MVDFYEHGVRESEKTGLYFQEYKQCEDKSLHIAKYISNLLCHDSRRNRNDRVTNDSMREDVVEQS